jgi:hypothetical protein
MSAVSDCIRTLAYFRRKYSHLMTGPDDIVGPDRKAAGKRGTGQRGTSISPEEHDQIFAEAQRPDLSLTMIARKHGRAISLICRVRNRRHPLYDAQRCEPTAKEGGAT